MKRSTSVRGVLGIILGVLVYSSAAFAHSEQAAVCVRTYKPIEVDGDLKDWVKELDSSNWEAQLEIKKGKVTRWIRAVPGYINHLNSHVEAGNVKDANDFSAVFYTLWDEQNFYLAVIVKDNEVITREEGGDIWKDDCMEVWFDAYHDAFTPEMVQDDDIQFGLSPKSKFRDTTLGFAWRNPGADKAAAAIAHRVASKLTEDGYVIEAAIPWQVINGAEPQIGKLMGFNISGIDKDKNKAWTHVIWSGVSHSNPMQFGHIYFVDEPVTILPSEFIQLLNGKESGKKP